MQAAKLRKAPRKCLTSSEALVPSVVERLHCFNSTLCRINPWTTTAKMAETPMISQHFGVLVCLLKTRGLDFR